jgi:hypothetical protein
VVKLVRSLTGVEKVHLHLFQKLNDDHQSAASDQPTPDQTLVWVNEEEAGEEEDLSLAARVTADPGISVIGSEGDLCRHLRAHLHEWKEE